MQHISQLLPTGADHSLHRGARRRSQRFPLDARVEIHGPMASSGFVLNASEGGLRVVVDRGYVLGALLELDVLFASGRASRERARVVWSRPQPDGWVLGLAFEGLAFEG